MTACGQFSRIDRPDTPDALQPMVVEADYCQYHAVRPSPRHHQPIIACALSVLAALPMAVQCAFGATPFLRGVPSVSDSQMASVLGRVAAWVAQHKLTVLTTKVGECYDKAIAASAPDREVRLPMKFSQLPAFDIARLPSDTERRHYANVLARVDEVSASFVQGYKPSGAAGAIAARYVECSDFNAATWQEGNGHIIGLGAAVIPLLSTLFSVLLSDPDVLPALPTMPKRRSSNAYRAQFRLDPLKATTLKKVTVALTEERASAARVLSDLCVSFIYLHEIGHIVCGHVGAIQHFSGGEELTEYVASKHTPTSELQLRQYWEYQADAIAAALIPQYIETLLARADQHHQWIYRIVSGRVRKTTLTLHVIALVNMSLTIMFHYLEGCRLEHLAEAAHPHPVVRSLYVDDIVAGRAGKRFGCDPHKIGKLQYDYLEPFLFALAKIGLASVQDWDVKILGQMQDKAAEIMKSREHREVARPWSWVPVDEWG